MKATFYSLLADGDPEGGLQPAATVPAEAFATDDHAELVHASYVSDESSVTSGVWECAPCTLPIESYPVNEMMSVISGSITVTDSDGRSETYGPGDSFFVAKGTNATFQITEKLRKFFMTSV